MLEPKHSGLSQAAVEGSEAVRCDKRVKRLPAVVDGPRRNTTCEVCRLEAAQGMDPMCTQNPWAITAVLLYTAGQKLFLLFRVHTLSEGAR